VFAKPPAHVDKTLQDPHPAASAVTRAKVPAIPARPAQTKAKHYAILLAITFAALVIHGYHPFAEDAEIYIPGIVTILHPSYYPFGREFFETHAHLTLFPNLIALSIRVTRLPLDWALFLWHFATLFLFLLACWRIAAKCFPAPQSRWAAVALVAALLTLPVAGTALYIFDQYLNPRSFSIFSVLFAIDAAIDKKYLRTLLWLAFTAVIHPLMTVFGVAFIILMLIFKKYQAASSPPLAAAAALFPILSFRSPSAIYWNCLQQHRYYFLFRWHWYEWLGAVAPLVFLWWFARTARRENRGAFELLSAVTAVFGLIFFVAAVIIGIPRSLELLEVYQPLRSLQLVYVFLLLFAGGLLGEHLLKRRPLRWAALFLPICAGMLYAQLQLFPGNRHVEWPGADSGNPWLQSFAWIRKNTPTNAIFALDPHFMNLPGEDHQGFRAAAERSRLADATKDWSAAVLYPWLPFADHVFAQTQALRGWRHFGQADFRRLNKEYGVSWVVLQQSMHFSPGPCPYQNSSVRVCRIE